MSEEKISNLENKLEKQIRISKLLRKTYSGIMRNAKIMGEKLMDTIFSCAGGESGKEFNKKYEDLSIPEKLEKWKNAMNFYGIEVNYIVNEDEKEIIIKCNDCLFEKYFQFEEGEPVNFCTVSLSHFNSFLGLKFEQNKNLEGACSYKAKY